MTHKNISIDAARTALKSYDDEPYSLSDLLADLMHLASATGQDFDEELARARRNFDDEVAEDKLEADDSRRVESKPDQQG
jgi:hypothetical protein